MTWFNQLGDWIGTSHDHDSASVETSARHLLASLLTMAWFVEARDPYTGGHLWRRTRMLNCHQATRLISESQELPLSLQKKWALKMHVMMCSGCRNFSLQVPFLSKAMRAYANGKDEEIRK